MADVFVSYSSEDHDRVEPLVNALERRGWTVWWAPQILGGDDFRTTIDTELAAAACVVVVWSTRSVTRRWVREEADDGAERGVLVPVVIDAVKPARGFREIETIDLVEWAQAPDDDLLGALFASIEQVLSRPRVVRTGEPPVPRPPRRAWRRFAHLVRRRALPVGLMLGGGAALAAALWRRDSPPTVPDSGRFAIDTAVRLMIDTLRTVPPASRTATLARLELILDSVPSVSAARVALAEFVQVETRWPRLETRCTESVVARADIAQALRILLRSRRPDVPPARLRLDSTNLFGVAIDSADLRHASLVDACLDSARLEYAHVDSADFTRAWLRHASLEFATGRRPVFADARLEDASLNGARLPGADLSGARLGCATLQYATLDSAQFLGARMPLAFFDAASLRGVSDWQELAPPGVTGAFLRTAKLDPAAKAWAYANGADTTSTSGVDWAVRLESRGTRDSLCARIVREVR